MEKKLYRSKDKKIAGVCSGIAEYFDIDPTIVRILWVLFVLAGGSGILIYIIMAFIVPEKPASIEKKESGEASSEGSSSAAGDNWQAQKESAQETEAHTSE
ncbi:MAG: PspC domain-containing protein [Treponema sp.]|nr:PspC domain-containing protein [Treponema sp.]